jgi:acyl carrier protein
MNAEDRVRRTLQRALFLSDDQIAHNASFGDDLAVSSLDRLEIMMAIEDEFGIELTEEEQASIKTVNDLIKCVQSHNQI